MAVLNIALLTALLPAVLALPGLHGRGVHGPYIPTSKHGYPTGFPHPSGVRGGPGPYASGAHGGHHHHQHPSGAPIGTAPFPVGNGTSTGPTGTGIGISGGSSSGVESGSSQTGGPATPVTIMSTVNLIPMPVTTDIYGSPLTTGAPGAPGSSPSESAAPGAPGSGLPGSQAPGSQSPGSQAPGSQSPGSQAPGSQSPGSQSPGSQSPGSQSPGSQSPGQSPASESPGSPGSGAGEAGATCGPATVTVTQAQTVTVTVPPNSPESGAPGVPGTPESGPAQAPSSAPREQPTFSAPFPIGSAGPTGTGTGTIGTGISHPTYHMPVPLPAHSSPTVVEKPKAIINSPVPTEAATEAAPAAPETTSSTVAATVPVKALYHAPAAQQQQQQQPAAPVQQPHTVASPAEAPTSAAAPVESSAAPTSAAAPVESSVAPTSAAAPVESSATPTSAAAPVESSAAPQSSTPKSSSGVKARGVLYSNSGMSSESALSAANSFDLSNIGWGWNWDSSPAPASGAATGSLNVQFVPMLLTLDSSHTSIWESNCAGAEWIMGFNEPDQCGGGGGCMQVSDVVQGWNTYFAGKSASKVSPATTNDIQTQGKGLSYMSEFLGACTGCSFDALAFHYYGPGSDLTTLKNTISAYQKLQQQYGIAELWITEMAPTDGPSSSEIASMLSFLDSSGVDRYAFNGLNTGSGVPLTGSMASAYCS